MASMALTVLNWAKKSQIWLDRYLSNYDLVTKKKQFWMNYQSKESKRKKQTKRKSDVWFPLQHKLCTYWGVKVSFFRKCKLFVKSPKNAFQITILNLEFEFPTHNSKQLTYSNFKWSTVLGNIFFRRMKKCIALSKKKLLLVHSCDFVGQKNLITMKEKQRKQNV